MLANSNERSCVSPGAKDGRGKRLADIPALVLAILLFPILALTIPPAAMAQDGERAFLPIVGNPSLPADPGTLVYTIDSGAQREIYTLDPNPDGSGRSRLTDNEAVDDMPAWSQDGQLIAFTSDRRQAGFYEIHTMNAQGGDVERLTSFDPDSTAWDDNSPSFSPSGDRIAFASNRSGVFQIFVMNSNGSNQVALTSDQFQSGSPDWASSGEKIVYSTQEAGGLDIFVMNADGSNKQKITTAAGAHFAPAWSPDGRQIVFTSVRNGERRLYVMDADGSNEERLTDSYSDWPDWSPDGTRIVFTRRDEESPALSGMTAGFSTDAEHIYSHRSSLEQANSDLYTIRPDGTDLQPLTETEDAREDRGNWGP